MSKSLRARTALGAIALAGAAACGSSTPAGGQPPKSASRLVRPPSTATVGGSRVRISPLAPSVTSSPACSTAAVLAGWDLPRLAAQTLAVPAREADLAAVDPEVASGAGGVVLFGSAAPAALAARLASLAALAPGGVKPLVLTDEEGGSVQRMANLVGALPSAREMGSTMSPAQIEHLALVVGRRMRAAGVSADLAPVLDLDSGPGPNARDAIGSRSFGAVPRVSTLDGLAFIRGMEQAGVLPVVKHFPGLGGASGNTDLTAASTLPWRTLERSALLPFEAAIRAGAPALMVTNASVPGLTTFPADISAAVVTRVLRESLGFNGLVLTDSLSTPALSAVGYPVPRAAVAALRAGADLVLFTPAASQVATVTAETVQAITAAVRTGLLPYPRLLSAVTRVLAAKHISLCPAVPG